MEKAVNKVKERGQKIDWKAATRGWKEQKEIGRLEAVNNDQEKRGTESRENGRKAKKNVMRGESIKEDDAMTRMDRRK